MTIKRVRSGGAYGLKFRWIIVGVTTQNEVRVIGPFPNQSYGTFERALADAERPLMRSKYRKLMIRRIQGYHAADEIPHARADTTPDHSDTF